MRKKGRTDRQTDRGGERQKDKHDKVNSRFRNFVNDPENWLTYYFCSPVTSNPRILAPFIESDFIYNVLK